MTKSIFKLQVNSLSLFFLITVRQLLYFVTEKLKYCLGSTVVICNTQNEVNKLSELLKLSAINHFKSGDIESENGMGEIRTQQQ